MRDPYEATGFQMIRSIDIRNFRCYSHLALQVPGRLNVIVGDNGSGKTSLLEAIFLALCTTTQIALRYRQERGMEGSFNGTARRVEEAIFGDLFRDRNSQIPVTVRLEGDGDENRSVIVSRVPGSSVLPFGEDDASVPYSNLPIRFAWTNASGQVFEVQPTITGSALSFPETGEDQANFFFVQANSMITSTEVAQRFTDLRQLGRREQLSRFIAGEYPWVEGLTVEALAGSPVLFAELKGGKSLPLPTVSSGINRLVAFLVCIASRPRSVVLIDEIEIGMHYSHHAGVWRGLLQFMRAYDSQLFVTTHSQECLEALVEAAGDAVSDVALWRVDRENGAPVVRQFSGETLRAGILTGGEVR